eukprot:COSAG05_NODE_1579_length_4497_cov_4.735789_1_plen_133_part_00
MPSYNLENLVDFNKKETEPGQILVRPMTKDGAQYATHWGIYGGGNTVYDCPGGANELDLITDVKIRKTTLSEFLNDEGSIKVCKVKAGRRTLEMSKDAAKARVGETFEYRMLTHNCIYFTCTCDCGNNVCTC